MSIGGAVQGPGVAGVIATEAGDLSRALERFGQAINLLTERASAYNNRAQARRLQGDVTGEGRHPETSAEGVLKCTDERDKVAMGPGNGSGESLNTSGICILTC